VNNEEIAARLADFGALLELAGAGYYSQRAYRRAAELIRQTPAPVADLVRSGRIRELRGIGPGIEARLRELVETGEIAELTELERSVSLELAAFGRLVGIGAQRATEIGRALGIRTSDELREAAAAGRLREVRGIGPKVEARIREALEHGVPEAAPRLLLSQARAVAEALAAALGGIAAGDARRWLDTPRRLSVVVPAADPEPVRERFAALPEIVAFVGPDLGVTLEGVPVELVVAPQDGFGTALVRSTGSPEYVDALEPLPVAPDERTVFARLGLPFVQPELREGEPSREPPPALVELTDVRGDLHVHTTASDGRASVLEMARAARDLGYEYLAICDHTPSVTVVPGLDADGLRRQAEEIGVANDELAPFRVLRGAECDIRRDGSLDLPDDVLAELQWVQLSLHAGQRTPGRELTKRVTEAMRHPAVRCLSHPTGRLIGHRPENALDLDETFAVALETGVALEVNGLPDRLDLSGEHVRRAIEAGVRVVCSTDAHSVAGLRNMALSVHTARRGRATAADVLNTRSWIEFGARGEAPP
jgi:DNA polymerase (family X)